MAMMTSKLVHTGSQRTNGSEAAAVTHIAAIDIDIHRARRWRPVTRVRPAKVSSLLTLMTVARLRIVGELCMKVAAKSATIASNQRGKYATVARR
jgi:hypothetical protein